MLKFLNSGFDVTDVCRYSNDRKLAAKNCQEANTELLLTTFIRDRPVTTMGIVSKIEDDNVGVCSLTTLSTRHSHSKTSLLSSMLS